MMGTVRTEIGMWTVKMVEDSEDARDGGDGETIGTVGIMGIERKRMEMGRRWR